MLYMLPGGRILTSWCLCEADRTTTQAGSQREADISQLAGFSNSAVTLGYIGATFYRDT